MDSPTLKNAEINKSPSVNGEDFVASFMPFTWLLNDYSYDDDEHYPSCPSNFWAKLRHYYFIRSLHSQCKCIDYLLISKKSKTNCQVIYRDIFEKYCNNDHYVDYDYYG
ncbi:hypothetical protein DERF_014358 [Dermatophagoides farinae]|uniref:Uncharacterized protein n=1 Tax=Dermatophagoides farinae TaxID=6954 RepID=A0A922KYY7_DERFA|nr:hypothetical protein DERF_014358 [Dermatophagoides farinae]